ncbi:putative potassium channel protein [Enhygromyxa salina]|uniref:Putative potassium channel protein n=1 Tax=Enhygromyxa salina TaxID=215803 RepID=A0A0C2CUR4_9BACT|nr:potassium channel family protein [Enhygromyxa salina]KIG13320.1 putative potassium channel protein [Enhygromyxa salina]
MLLRLIRLARRVRDRRAVGLVVVAMLLATALVGNAVCFYTFEHAANPTLTWGDACWHSVVSVTTIGYGDYSATTVGGRLGTIAFIVLFGLTSFSLFFGMMLDWASTVLSNAHKGLGRAMVQDHILIVHFPSAQRVRQVIDEIRSDPEYRTCEIVVVSTAIESLPFDVKNVVFVRGSSHDVQTYKRARIEACRMAMVLSPDYSDRNSDAIVAAAVSVIDRLESEVHIVAECADEKHLPLFEACNCDSVILGMSIAGNLLVQEVHDPGIAQLIEVLTSNRRGTTLFSTAVTESDVAYIDMAKALHDHAINVVAVNRGTESNTILEGLRSQVGDRIIYAGAGRVNWASLRARAGC